MHRRERPGDAVVGFEVGQTDKGGALPQHHGQRQRQPGHAAEPDETVLVAVVSGNPPEDRHERGRP